VGIFIQPKKLKAKFLENKSLAFNNSFFVT
jgi:hypothetical protein